MPRKIRQPIGTGELKLSPKVRKEIFSLVLSPENSPPITLEQMVKPALETLQEANRLLLDHPSTKILAESLFPDDLWGLTGKGDLTMRVSPEGDIYVGYSGDPNFRSPVKSVKEKLPSLGAIREKARSLGVDVSDLGRKKILMVRRIKKHMEALKQEQEDNRVFI